MNEIYHHALKLLRRRDYTQKQLQERLEERFGTVPEEIPWRLRANKFLDDRRYAGNFVAKHPDAHPDRIREQLREAGVEAGIIDEAIGGVDWPSLRSVLKAKMTDWRLTGPLQKRDAVRLFRVLSRLGYPEDEIREELEQLHEQ